MSLFRRTSLPLPENVRLVTATGREIPVEMLYLGKCKRIHRWQAVAYIHLEPWECQPLALKCDLLPPKTEIEVRIKSTEPIILMPRDS